MNAVPSMKPRIRRLGGVALVLFAAAAAAALILNAFRSNLVFFFSPSQVLAGESPADRSFRLGGLVEAGSVRRSADGLQAEFVLTDTVERVPVVYHGILPDLFAEGEGAVALGRLQADGRFVADQVLAKHDETYMPPEVAEALQTAGMDPVRKTPR